MQTDAKHMSEASFICHLLMVGDGGGGRKCNSVPLQKLPYVVKQWRLLMLGVLSRELTEGEGRHPKINTFASKWKDAPLCYSDTLRVQEN